MFLVLGTQFNKMNAIEIIGHLFEVAPSYTEVVEVHCNPYSDLPLYYLGRRQMFESFEDFTHQRALHRLNAKKGSLYGECSRSVCTNEAHYEHRDLVGQHYCLKCARKINQSCNDDTVVPIPFQIQHWRHA